MPTENQDAQNGPRNVKIKIEVTSDIQITAFVACQNANVFLLNHLGNLVSAGDPALQVAGDRLRWKVPIRCALSKKGMQTIGDLAVDVNTGEILLSESTPSNLETLRNIVDLTYATTERAASFSGNG